MPRSLGLDIGNRRIGVAVSDSMKVIARPVEVIDRKHQDALKQILHHVLILQPDEIVVGYPLNADGSAGPQAHKVAHFADLVRATVGIPVLLADERYSTGEAKTIMSTRKRKDQTKPDDAIAAAVILQRFLDERHAYTRPNPESIDPEPSEDRG